jgi:hypothetical protein
MVGVALWAFVRRDLRLLGRQKTVRARGSKSCSILAGLSADERRIFGPLAPEDPDTMDSDDQVSHSARSGSLWRTLNQKGRAAKIDSDHDRMTLFPISYSSFRGWALTV